MKVLYSDQPAFQGGLSIFLAGPTPRSTETRSWRPDAIRMLEDLNFDGTVLVPERRDWTEKFDYADQVDWETQGLERATVISFWVARNLKTMPAIDTNFELGTWLALSPKRLVYGHPPEAERVRYSDRKWKQATGLDPCTALEFTMAAAVKLANTRWREQLTS